MTPDEAAEEKIEIYARYVFQTVPPKVSTPS